jgi:riboflavin kinase/FMN adenylyltransferase
MPGARIALADVEPRPRRVAVGVFDGVHLGHREVVRGADCALTFDPHPLAVLAPERAPRLMATVDRRVELLAEQGVREVVVIPFDRDFAALSAQEFVDDILVGRLCATHVSVGENFRFGRGGAGDAAMLGRDPRFATRTVPLVTIDGAIVSSTAVRTLLAEGDVDRAGRLLGRPLAAAT